MLSRFSHVQLFTILWTIACQAPLSMGFSRQEYWSGLPCPPPGDLPHPGTEPSLLRRLHWQVNSLPLAPPGKLKYFQLYLLIFHSKIYSLSLGNSNLTAAAAAAKSLQSCLTLCDPIDSSPPGSPIPGILQARTLEWVAISFSNAWKWKVKVKSFSRVQLFSTPWTAAHQALLSMRFSRQEYWSGVPLPSPSNLTMHPVFLTVKSSNPIQGTHGNVWRHFWLS